MESRYNEYLYESVPGLSDVDAIILRKALELTAPDHEERVAVLVDSHRADLQLRGH